MSSTSITLLIPVFNEAGAVCPNLRAILRHLDTLDGFAFQVLLVDDGSTDATVEELRSLVEEDPRLSLLCLTRNFGKEAAIHAGLEHLAPGANAVIVMDSDLQHPPSLIGDMLRFWQQGIAVVEAYKTHRGDESWSSRWLVKRFYRLFYRLSGMDLTNHSDFKLLDRRVVDALKQLPERERFFRGMVPWLGFTSVGIPFEVPPRTLGKSRWPQKRLWRYSLGAITSFSSVPLHIITLLGGFTFLISLAIAAKALYDKATGNALGGFTTVILVQLFIGSVLMISLGLIGAYIARIYDEVKHRPSYLIDKQKSSLLEKHKNTLTQPHSEAPTPNIKGRDHG